GNLGRKVERRLRSRTERRGRESPGSYGVLLGVPLDVRPSLDGLYEQRPVRWLIEGVEVRCQSLLWDAAPHALKAGILKLTPDELEIVHVLMSRKPARGGVIEEEA